MTRHELRHEIASLVAEVINRIMRVRTDRNGIRHLQNLPPSAQSTLPVSSSTLQQCPHDKPVNDHGEHGEPR
jgi:hypothetical protein